MTSLAKDAEPANGASIPTAISGWPSPLVRR